jgi:hypothetical protein
VQSPKLRAKKTPNQTSAFWLMNVNLFGYNAFKDGCYDPIVAGSIDGTDAEPHDHGIKRACAAQANNLCALHAFIFRISQKEFTSQLYVHLDLVDHACHEDMYIDCALHFIAKYFFFRDCTLPQSPQHFPSLHLFLSRTYTLALCIYAFICVLCVSDDPWCDHLITGDPAKSVFIARLNFSVRATLTNFIHPHIVIF